MKSRLAPHSQGSEGGAQSGGRHRATADVRRLTCKRARHLNATAWSVPTLGIAALSGWTTLVKKSVLIIVEFLLVLNKSSFDAYQLSTIGQYRIAIGIEQVQLAIENEALVFPGLHSSDLPGRKTHLVVSA